MDRKTKEILMCGMVIASILLITGRNVNADVIFGKPTNLGSIINSPDSDQHPAVSADGLLLYFSSNRPGGYGDSDLWISMRETTNHPWGPPVNLDTTINSAAADRLPHISADGLTLLFVSDRTGGAGHYDIYMATRATIQDTWGVPVNLGPTINSTMTDSHPFITNDGLSLYFSSDRGSGARLNNLYVARRATVEDEWGEPENLGPIVNSTSADIAPCISPDALWLFFASFRPGGFGLVDLYVTTRSAHDESWNEPTNMGSTVNSPARESCPKISPDGRTLYFHSDRPDAAKQHDIWQASIIPIVDFNGDGTIDLVDMVMLIDHWETDDTLFDIGPMPWGDGVVDIEDLKVFIEHWEEDNLANAQENE
jgi:Tol biopolymer transport system component